MKNEKKSPILGKLAPLSQQAKEQKLASNAAKKLLIIIKTIPIDDFTLSKGLTITLEEHDIFHKAAALSSRYDFDVIETIQEHFHLFRPSKSVKYEISQRIRELREEYYSEKKRVDKVRRAEARDYYELYTSVLGPLKRDIFSESLLYLDKYDHLWKPAANQLRPLRARAAKMEDQGKCKFSKERIEDHLYELEDKSPRELVPDIPEWDRRDRIQEIADCLHIEESQGFTMEMVEEVLKSWGAGIFRRLKDPMFQNRILILGGPQGIGKDFLVENLVGGFGQWACNVTLTRNENDNLLQLHRAAVLKIAEFDRTAKMEVSALKDMITRPDTDIRAPYAREAQRRICRCSFVATCNIDDIFRDPTGHRRYLVLKLKRIDWKYPLDQMQILAQFQQLAEEKYELKEITKKTIAQFLEENTPESIDDEICQVWEELVQDWSRANPIEALEAKERGWLTNSEVREAGILQKLSKEVGCNERFCRRKLKLGGYWLVKKIGAKTQRGYLTSTK